MDNHKKRSPEELNEDAEHATEFGMKVAQLAQTMELRNQDVAVSLISLLYTSMKNAGYNHDQIKEWLVGIIDKTGEASELFAALETSTGNSKAALDTIKAMDSDTLQAFVAQPKDDETRH